MVQRGSHVEILKWLCEVVHRKRPELWHSDWILHHDNAPSQKALYEAVCGPKINYQKGTPTLFTCFGSE